MSDQQEPQNTPNPSPPASAEPTQAATPNSNQNLIIGIVLGAVALLLLLLVINQQFSKGGDSGDDKDLEALQKELDEKKRAAAELRYASGAQNVKNAEVLLDSINRDTKALAGLAAANSTNAAELRAANQALISSQETNRALQTKLAQYQTDAARVPGLTAQITELQNRLATVVDKQTADAMRDELARVKAEKEKLIIDLAQFSDQYNILKSDHELLRANCEILRAELKQIKAAMITEKLFVTADELSPRAQELYRELERLEGSNRGELEQSYVRIKKDFRAEVVRAIQFETGKSELHIEHEDYLRQKAQAYPENSFFLVVGYASKTGNPQTNEELSSERATEVATVVHRLKQQTQQVQAVYLGATDRFSKTEPIPNQICEVWEIRP